jgi:hypothetical protein
MEVHLGKCDERVISSLALITDHVDQVKQVMPDQDPFHRLKVNAIAG